MTMPTTAKPTPPPAGQKISISAGRLMVPDHPVIPFIEGDGTGPDIWRASVRVMDAAVARAYGQKRRIEWMEVYAGEKSHQAFNSWLPDETVAACREYLVSIKGPLTTPVGGGIRSLNVALRQMLDLYVCLRPVRWFKGVPSPVKSPEKVDMVIFRENTEDLYSGLEHEVVPGVVESLKIITEKASTRIAKFAFEYAERHGRKKIHAIHKANIMKLSDGLFLKSVRAVAAKFPAIEYKELIVDNACMQIVMDPLQFDMLLLPNLYGDVMSDLAAGLVGGLGVVPSANIGDECAMFEAVHGTAPDIAGKGFANPTALLMSSILMMDHLGERTTAERIRNALEKVYRQAKHTTRDVGGKAGTEEFADAVIAALKQR